jgi:cyanophycin synthetase
MIIRDIKILRGPNYWSNKRQKLIAMQLDLQEMEEKPSNKIEGFNDRLKKLIPTLYEHHCSEGHDGGLFERLDDGTWMGHIIEHVALEIQTLAGMECGFGRTRGTGEKGVYNVVFSYTEEKAGVFAAKAGVKIIEALIEGNYYDLENDIQILREIRESEKLGPSTSSIVYEAEKRGIPCIRLNHSSLVQLGYGVNQKRIMATITSHTSGIGVELACDKEDTKFLLDKAAIPVPKGCVIISKEELKIELEEIGFPCVIKPINGNHGRGATTNILNLKDALIAFELAKKHGDRIVLERFITGFDFRLLVINSQLVAAAKRTPAHIIGNGSSSIKELIDEENTDPRRGFGHENMLTEITIDEMTKRILETNDFTLDTVLSKNKVLSLKSTANLSTGGTAEDVTDSVHPYNIFMAERIARIIGLDICGIDVMASDLKKPINENGGAVIEVNAAPGFRMHLDPTSGTPRNVADPVIDMLYPLGSSSRIPIIAITGTNGKTTTTRLIAHILKGAGFKVGYTTSDGIYIQNRLLQKGDCTGPQSAKFVLADPTVDFAVLETARGGILREGLGFSFCDIGIVTNVSPDHLGLKGIQTLEQLARVKSVVVENVNPEGYSILNADDDLVLGMIGNIKSKIALFSINENNEHINSHCKEGGIAAICENGFITINKGGWKIKVEKVVNIPLTFSGKADFMIQNVLAATLTAFLRNIHLADIQISLQTFVPSVAITPGRMNLFQFREFSVLLDYAHNPSGMHALGEFLRQTEGYPKVGIISGTGDRRDEDIIELGEISSTVFDEIIIRQDPELRGRTQKEIGDLLIKGIRKNDPNKLVDKSINERQAILTSIQNAKKGSFITVLSDDIENSIHLLEELIEKENSEINYVKE